MSEPELIYGLYARERHVVEVETWKRIMLEDDRTTRWRVTGAIQLKDTSINHSFHEFLQISIEHIDTGTQANIIAERKVEWDQVVAGPQDLLTEGTFELIRSVKFDNARRTLTIRQLAWILNAVRSSAPKYKLLWAQCYWFCARVYDIIKIRYYGLESIHDAFAKMGKYWKITPWQKPALNVRSMDIPVINIPLPSAIGVDLTPFQVVAEVESSSNEDAEICDDLLAKPDKDKNIKSYYAAMNAYQKDVVHSGVLEEGISQDSDESAEAEIAALSKIFKGDPKLDLAQALVEGAILRALDELEDLDKTKRTEN
ncbi:hypothetical protein BV22DRAFT_1132909 [Leucogyrophana mollusca]|uniref:Uncharacterized protein n=1 Tax=Leucogyrophana mollusca TaxID=85980 RepID=A0ACB8B4B7_9AGAM|nr:hypothetical protein BV22DRAFT_1132909 [Leucogyrophana mollusca]